MSVFSGDFLGFTLGDTHSSQLNITRVSSGDRYEDILLPQFKDTTIEVPGGDGTYYLDTFYSQKPFTLNFAYDDLRDEDLRALRRLFGFKGIKQLILDEFPYKKYMVKLAAPPTFRYICFDHLDTRLYKGEGSLQLIAYYPYAMATFSPSINNANNGGINNAGDLPAELKIYFAHNSLPTLIKLNDNKGRQLGKMTFKPFSLENGDNYIVLNSKTHLVEGLDENFNKTGHLYNKYIDTGDFFDAPVGRSIFLSATNFYKLEYTPLYY